MYRLKKAQAHIPKVAIPVTACNNLTLLKDQTQRFIYPSPELDMTGIIELLLRRHNIYDQLVNYPGEWTVKIESLTSRPLVVSKYTSYDADPAGRSVISVAHVSQAVLSLPPTAPPSITISQAEATDGDIDLYFDPLIEFDCLPSGRLNPIGVLRWNSNYRRVQTYHDQLELDDYVAAWARRIHDHYVAHESVAIMTLN